MGVRRDTTNPTGKPNPTPTDREQRGPPTNSLRSRERRAFCKHASQMIATKTALLLLSFATLCSSQLFPTSSRYAVSRRRAPTATAQPLARACALVSSSPTARVAQMKESTTMQCSSSGWLTKNDKPAAADSVTTLGPFTTTLLNDTTFGNDDTPLLVSKLLVCQLFFRKSDFLASESARSAGARVLFCRCWPNRPNRPNRIALRRCCVLARARARQRRLRLANARMRTHARAQRNADETTLVGIGLVLEGCQLK